MKQKFIDAYMDVAKRFANLSSAKRLQVGAIVVKDDRIISIGYNGMPSGWTNECEDYIQLSDDTITTKTKPEVIHAEANAIAKLAKGSESGDGSTMFLTHAPCLDCAKQIYTAGINKVYYNQSYRDTLGVDFLKKCNVRVEQCKDGVNT
jgi:dCMP deaminase